jgi:FKBP-type peptidyl-prolyl cis-trans isomerase SlyD
VKIEPNSRVVLEYTLRQGAGDGAILDSSDAEGGEPIVYVHGYGMLVPGLERGLLGLTAGDARSIVVGPEAGYGERDEELVLEVDRGELPRPDAVAVGDELVAEDADGEEAVMHVVAVHAESVVLDGNHPLAGETLHYAIKVREVRPATEGEIAEAAGAFEAAGYEPPPSEPNLVQLGRGGPGRRPRR